MLLFRMKISRRGALAALGLSFSAAKALFAIDTREAAPRFKAKSLDGELFTNDSIRGKVVLLQFWATWCQYCRSDQPAVEALTREFAGQGLVVLGVNVGESKKTVKRYLETSPRSSKTILTEDTNLAAMFSPHSFPLYVLIDRSGKVAGEQKGAGGERALSHLLGKALSLESRELAEDSPSAAELQSSPRRQ
jgi:thiol-disulfide isomerase/thioredoxin